jgi:hypothetical protein
LEAFDIRVNSFIFSNMPSSGSSGQKKGRRRSLPDLIYHIQIELVDHQASDLSARPLLIGKSCFNRQKHGWTLTVTVRGMPTRIPIPLSPPIRRASP